jgi:hypothetical protein
MSRIRTEGADSASDPQNPSAIRDIRGFFGNWSAILRLPIVKIQSAAFPSGTEARIGHPSFSASATSWTQVIQCLSHKSSRSSWPWVFP